MESPASPDMTANYPTPDQEAAAVTKQVQELSRVTGQIDVVLDILTEANVYDKLSTEDKVKHDLFVSYALASLHWMYLRTIGEDPTTHPVKAEIERVQEYVKKYQRVKDRKSRPVVKKAEAKRFVKHGLFDPRLKPQNKRKIFNNDD